MQLWHLTQDTPRLPASVAPDERVELLIGTWPIEPGQKVWVQYTRTALDGVSTDHLVEAHWRHNVGSNSYWSAHIGPFARGDEVEYELRGSSPYDEAGTERVSFKVGARLHLALLWHQHQPLYKDVSRDDPRGSYLRPWVRLHAVRDYYSMAALVAQHPDIHLTFNLTPVLLWQLEDYTERGATDRQLELTLTPAEDLTPSERDEIVATFFDADPKGQILPHPRYRELFERRAAGDPFETRDLRDLQAWFNLAWFGHEFRTGVVDLVTGERVSVAHLIAKGRGFSRDDVTALIAEQYKIMHAVVPIHRKLQDEGQIEVATSPFYHPILPLLIDTDDATVDRPGAERPRRFSYPQDARDQVTSAVEFYRERFGRPPRGMWPPEGAVSRAAASIFAGAGLSWTASDRGVLARSGRWGYDTSDPDVLYRPYRAEEDGHAITIFFRDTELSDEIGFHYQGYSDHEAAARDFVRQIRDRLVTGPAGPRERVLTIVLDGENAWGAYPQDARPFLHALYGELERSPDLVTVTFAECLTGAPERDLEAHHPADQWQLHELFTGSWIDENGSLPGVDLGTWVGEPEENSAWELLGDAREALARSGATPASHPAAFQAMHTAEGSDWFWWFGEDQDSGNDQQFDELFRMHLANVYRGARLAVPENLAQPITPRTLTWSFGSPLPDVGRRDRLRVRTKCPGVLAWRLDGGQERTQTLRPVGGAMAGARNYQAILGPFAGATSLEFRFEGARPTSDGTAAPSCRPDWHALSLAPDGAGDGGEGGGQRRSGGPAVRGRDPGAQALEAAPAGDGVTVTEGVATDEPGSTLEAPKGGRT